MYYALILIVCAAAIFYMIKGAIQLTPGLLMILGGMALFTYAIDGKEAGQFDADEQEMLDIRALVREHNFQLNRVKKLRDEGKVAESDKDRVDRMLNKYRIGKENGYIAGGPQ